MDSINQALVLDPPPVDTAPPENAALQILVVSSGPLALPRHDSIAFTNRTGARCDALIAVGLEPEALDEVVNITPAGDLLPIACFGRNAVGWVDYHYDRASPAKLEEAVEALAGTARRFATLPGVIKASEDPATLLLARTWLRGGKLEAVHDPSVSSFVSYHNAGRIPAPQDLALELTSRGLMASRFFDRFHTCPDCRSARLNVREECSSCKSANLREVQIVHHFKCAYEGPEYHFRRGDRLTCPKCSLDLTHLGLDYDKPGSVLQCMACSQSNDAPTIGFVCIDCGRHQSAEGMPVVNRYSFTVTAAGERAVRTGSRSPAAPPMQDRAFSVLLRQAIRELDHFGTPFCVLRLGFHRGAELMARDERLWHRSRALAYEVLCGFARPVDSVIETVEDFFLLMARAGPREGRRTAAALGQRLPQVLAHDLDPSIAVLDPTEARALLETVP